MKADNIYIVYLSYVEITQGLKIFCFNVKWFFLSFIFDNQLFIEVEPTGIFIIWTIYLNLWNVLNLKFVSKEVTSSQFIFYIAVYRLLSFSPH